LDFRLTLLDTSRSFHQRDKRRLQKELLELPFVCNVVVDNLAIKVDAWEEFRRVKIDIVPKPQTGRDMDVEDFPRLRGGTSRPANEDKMLLFLGKCEPAQVAVSCLKMLLHNPYPPSILLEAAVKLVAEDTHYSEEWCHPRLWAPYLCLQTLEELGKGSESKMLGERLEADLRELHIREPSWAGDVSAALASIESLVEPAQFFKIWTKVNRTCADMRWQKYRDPAYFRPNPESKMYKCIFCDKYNDGVGLYPDSRCQNCNSVQTSHPGFGDCEVGDVMCGKWLMMTPKIRGNRKWHRIKSRSLNSSRSTGL